MCLYQTLGVETCATEKELRKVFKQLAVHHHPDKGGNPQLFLRIQHALNTLLDVELRGIYDNHGYKGLQAHFDAKKRLDLQKEAEKHIGSNDEDVIREELAEGQAIGRSQFVRLDMKSGKKFIARKTPRPSRAPPRPSQVPSADSPPPAPCTPPRPSTTLPRPSQAPSADSPLARPKGKVVPRGSVGRQVEIHVMLYPDDKAKTFVFADSQEFQGFAADYINAFYHDQVLVEGMKRRIDEGESRRVRRRLQRRCGRSLHASSIEHTVLEYAYRKAAQ